MQSQFSPQLIDRMVEYAQRKWNLRISREEAEKRLRSLASVYITVSKIRARKHKPKTDDQSHAS